MSTKKTDVFNAILKLIVLLLIVGVFVLRCILVT